MTLEYLEHTPLTEEEALGLLPKGEYRAFIKKVEIKFGRKDVTQKYFVATVEVYDADGKPYPMTVWLAIKHLLKHMYDSTGNSDKYMNHKLLPSDCENQRCVVLVGVQEGTEQYPRPKNVILDFLAPKSQAESFNDPVGF